MTVFQRRLASSTYALLRSFERRFERLDELIRGLESGQLSEDQLRALQLRLDQTPDPFEERTGDEESAVEGLEENEVTEHSLLAGVLAVSLPQLREERGRVEKLRGYGIAPES